MGERSSRDWNRKKNGRFKRWMIGVFVCLFTLTSVPFQPARPVEAAPPSIADELLGDWLPQPGNQSTPSPFGPNRSEQEEPDVPSLGDHGANSEADEGQPEDPVLLPSGSLTFIEQDIEWEAPGFPITLQRMFSSERNEAGGAFGAGWSHPYEHRLTMYADFDIVEIRPEGTEVRYVFDPGDDSAILDEYDGDSLIYYDLSQGSYTSEEPYGLKLERISAREYRLTDPDGTVYTFLGYGATWREGSEPAAGKLTSIQDRNGNSVKLTYDSQGLLVRIADSVGRYADLTYNSAGRIVSVKDPLARNFTYSYDHRGNLSTAVAPDGRTWKYSYDGENRLTGILDPELVQSTFAYEGNRVKTYWKGQALVYQYAYSESAVVRTDALGGQTRYDLDENGRIQKMTDASGAALEYGYTETGRLSSTVSESSETTVVYNGKGLPIDELGSDGIRTLTTYNEWNQPLKLTVRSENKFSNETEASAERLWSYEYDDRGNLIKLIHSDGSIESWTYNSRGLMLTHTNRLGYTIKHSYNSLGQTVEITDAEGAKSAFTYDAMNRLLTTQLNGSHLQTFVYDNGDRLIELIDAAGGKHRSEFETNGRLKRSIDPEGLITSYTYDAAGRLDSVISPGGYKSEFRYDAMGRKIEERGPHDAAVTFKYDKLGRLIEKSGTFIPKETYAYDHDSRLIFRSIGQETTSFTYNTQGWLKDMETAGQTTRLTYDAWGNVIGMELPEGGKLSRIYDVNGQVTEATDASGATMHYTYDAEGQLIREKDAIGRVTEMTYDKLGNLISSKDHQ